MPILGGGEVVWTRVGDMVPGDRVVIADGTVLEVSGYVDLPSVASIYEHRELWFTNGNMMVVPAEFMVMQVINGAV